MTAKTDTPVDAKVEETKAEKFKRLALSRTEKAMAAIANIGGLASKANYEYTPEQVAKVFGYLEAEMTKLQARFRNPEAKDSGGISLD